MYSLRIKRLPVVDAGGGLVGLVTRTDLLAVYERPDTEIRAEIEDVILHEFLEDPRQFAVGVKDGIVTLQGNPETIALGHRVVRKVRHVPGVVAVRDRLNYPDEAPIVAAPLF
jgi:osmotically-inducible protein OsmY